MRRFEDSKGKVLRFKGRKDVQGIKRRSRFGMKFFRPNYYFACGINFFDLNLAKSCVLCPDSCVPI